MRLPEASELRTEAARSLYSHDVVEYHCTDPRNDYSRLYRQRLATMWAFAEPRLANCRLLDLGCAQGNVALLAAEAGAEAFAVDLRPDFLAYARMKYERGKFFSLAANATQIPFAGQSFDCVVWGEMIEHVAYPEQILKEISRVMKPGGLLLVSTPNGSRLHTKLPTFAQAGDRARFVSQQFKPDSDGHLFLYTRRELAGLMAQAGLQLVQHRYYATPWISGRLAFRYWMSWMPPALRSWLDSCTLAVPPLAARLAEGQVVLAQRN